jgi:hypothetical protein
MEPGGSLPYSKETTTCPYPEPDQSCSRPRLFHAHFPRLTSWKSSWRTTPCRLSATAYSIHSQLPTISGATLLHPQPEDAPCCGNRDRLIVGFLTDEIYCETRVFHCLPKLSIHYGMEQQYCTPGYTQDILFVAYEERNAS